MIEYFILFLVIGFIIMMATKEKGVEVTGLVILIVAIGWGVSHAFIWGLVSGAELALGAFLAYIFIVKNQETPLDIAE